MKFCLGAFFCLKINRLSLSALLLFNMRWNDIYYETLISRRIFTCGQTFIRSYRKFRNATDLQYTLRSTMFGVCKSLLPNYIFENMDLCKGFWELAFYNLTKIVFQFHERFSSKLTTNEIQNSILGTDTQRYWYY